MTPADPAARSRPPLTRREELVRDQLARQPHGSRAAAGGPPVRLGISGTGPSLLLLAWSAADLARERAAGARLLRRLGVAPGKRVANALPGALATPGSLLLGDVVEELGGLDVPLGSPDSPAAVRQAWELFDRVRPDVLIVDRAGGAGLLAAAPAGARSWWRGLVWLNAGTSAPLAVPAAAGFAGWQRHWLAVPEATSFVAGSCAAGRLHTEDDVVAEVADEATGAACAAGDVGTLVLTPIGFDAPIRYASGLRARVPSTACSCGDDAPGLEII